MAKNIIDSVMGGLNGTIFAYGQTSSGKTYTMQGGGSADRDTEGIVHMAAKDIFHIFKSIRLEIEIIARYIVFACPILRFIMMKFVIC